MAQAMSACLVKIRRVPSRQCRDARVYGHTTTAMHMIMSAPPPPPLTAPNLASLLDRCAVSILLCYRLIYIPQHPLTVASCPTRSSPPGCSKIYPPNSTTTFNSRCCSSPSFPPSPSSPPSPVSPWPPRPPSRNLVPSVQTLLLTSLLQLSQVCIEPLYQYSSSIARMLFLRLRGTVA